VSTPHFAVSDGPLSIQLLLPAELPGVQVARFKSDERLWRSVKERFCVALTYTGHSECWCRGRVATTGPGTVLLKPVGEVHRELRRDGPSRFQVVSFDKALVVEALETVGAPALAHLQPARFEREQPEVAPLVRLQELLGEEPPEPASALELQTALAEALSAFVLCASDTREPARRWRRPVRRALEVLQESLAENITLDELSARAGLDKFHLCRAFRDEVGLPPHAYLTHLRVSRSQQLLARGMTPSEVAHHVGFYDQSQLNRHFKRIVGMTPGQFARALS
jgi:AraC-like DNA-binding protein